MANKYDALIEKVPELVGGKENISGLTHCMTRIRMMVKDKSRVRTAELEKVPGVVSVVWMGTQVQLVIGAEVDQVYDRLCDKMGFRREDKIEENLDTGIKEKKNPFSVVLDYAVSIIMPLLPMFIAGGILRGILTLATNMKWLDAASSTYILLYGLAWAFMYFTPVLIANFAADKFKCNKPVAMALGAALVYPNVVAALGAEGGATLFGIPVANVTYSSSIFPIIITIAFMAFLEKRLKRIITNKNLQNIVVPLVTLLVSGILMYTVFGPVGGWIGNILASVYAAMLNLNPIICGAFIGFAWQILIMFGMHTAFVPVLMQEFTSTGMSTFCAFYSASSWCQYVAPIGVALKTKNKELRAECLSLAFTGIVGTAVEPCLYGINLRFKKPFVIAIIGGTIGGALAGALGAYSSGASYFGIYTWATYIASGVWKMLIAVGTSCLFTIVATYLFGYNDSMLEQK